MNQFNLSLLFLFVFFTSYSQINTSGYVKDASNDLPLEFVNVVISDTQNNIIGGTITDEKGYFQMKLPKKTEMHNLHISYVGYTEWSQKISLEKDIHIENIKLNISENQLNEIKIQAKKKTFVRKVDRLVFNVENSINSSEGDALDLLKITPGLRVRGDRITMMGKSGLQVMVNGKIIRLAGEELNNFLTSLSSEDIKSIEVITSPPARYDAEGNSGILNIITKKAKENSWNSQFWTYYRQRKYDTEAVGGSFNYNKNKFSLSSSLSYSNGKYYQEQDDYTYFPDGLWHTASPFTTDFESINGRLDLNYKFNSKWDLGAQYLYSNNDRAFIDSPITNVTDYVSEDLARSLKSNGKIKPKSNLHAVNINNTFVLDSSNRKLYIDFDYFDFQNDERSFYEGEQTNFEQSNIKYFKGINNNIQEVQNFSSKVDVEFPTKFAMLNFGGKVSLSDTKNNFDFFNSDLVDSPVEDYVLSSSDYTYEENIEALYFSLTKDLSEKLSAKVGLRMEATQTTSTSKNLMFDLKRDYIKYFPTFYLMYNSSDNSSFSLNYNRRIQRPNFTELNPNENYVNPFIVIEGNAFLTPSYNDNIEFTYNYKKLESKFYYSYESNVFGQISLPSASDNFVRVTNRNYIDRDRFGLVETYSFYPLKWWRSYNSFDVNYSISSFDLEQPHTDEKGFNASFSTYNTFYLNKSRTFYGGINFWLDFPGVDGISEQKSSNSLSLSLRYLMLNKNLSLAVRANDVFRGAVQRTESTVNNIHQRGRYYYDNQYFQISLSYKFGNNKIRVKRQRTGNTDERNRISN
ncbi:TonB-dependent receptor domain-containing protein [Aureivirga marina]|uniref:TonB-dependent receptor domain-containing protein n=1 Tax=Aureivirga marina TaxID=1182451 RepID=UPI0018C8E929|nr:outer membrane beta-barrel family protein [Aureivirga marina]